MTRILLLAVLLVSAPASAQNDHSADDAHARADAAVRATVTRLFDGMRAKDTTLIRSTLHPTARLMTATNRDGVRSVEASPLGDFLRAVAGAPVLLDEQIDETYPVFVDDGLAVAWTPYRFYAGEQFSHCGTNAFVMALGDEGWQIVQIMDTRRRNCDNANPEPQEE